MALIESSRNAALNSPTGQSFPGRGIMSPGTNAVDDDALQADQEEDGDLSPPPLHSEPPYSDDKDRLIAWTKEINIAKYIDAQVLGALGNLVVREFEIDEQSRAQWKEEAEAALNFATQKAEAKQYPWPNASNIIFPLISSASLRFAAMTYPALIEGRDLVRGVVWGQDDGTPVTMNGLPDGPPKLDAQQNIMWLVPPGAKEKRARLVGEHMSYQVLNEMPEWEPQFDLMLHQLPIVGGAVKKSFRDPVQDRTRSVLVPLMNMVWNRDAESFEMAPRHSELLTYQIYQITEFERAGETFLPYVYGPGDAKPDAGTAGDTQAPHLFIEQHRRYDLDGDGYEEPLIVTVHKATARVVRVVTRFEAADIEENDKKQIARICPTDYYTLYPFLPDPRGGSYPMGFGHLLKPLNESINTTINQMFDAGHLQIAGGGFIGTSLSIHSGPVNFQMGEFKPVNNKGQSIRDSVFPIPFPGPSLVLMQLLTFLVNAAKEIASIQDVLSGDPNLANVQPTTLLALIEQGMKLYTAIHKRIYRSFTAELKKIYDLNRRYLKQTLRYKVGDTWSQITPDDYRLGGGVVPSADPNMVTDTQKMARAMVLFALKDDPRIDGVEVLKRFVAAARTERPDKIVRSQPLPPPPQTQADLALSQAELGRVRAQELKDSTQGLLNMAQARKLANDQELAFLDQEMERMRLHIEALNTTVKAADVDAKMHGHNTNMKIAQLDARTAANEARNANQPPPSGPQPGVLPAMAPQSGNGGLPQIPR